MADIYLDTITNIKAGLQKTLDANIATIDELTSQNAVLSDQIDEADSIIDFINSSEPQALQPTLFTVTPSASLMSLTWDSMGDGYVYSIDYAMVSDFSTGVVNIYNGSYSPSIDLNTPSPGQHFYFRIKSSVAGLRDSDYAYDDAISI